MVSGISSSDDTGLQMLMQQMYLQMQKANTDGLSGLSKSELSSIDSGNDLGQSAFLESLSQQFDELDSDKNGQLSMDEIKSSNLTQEQMGPPVGMSIGSNEEENSATSSYSSLLEALTEATYDTLDANEDGIVSLDELQTAYGKSEKSGDAISDFIKNFDNYDSNQDGSLSSDEFSAAIEDAIKNGDIDAVAENETGDLKDNFKNLASTFVQKLIDTYKDGGIEKIASSLNSLV